MKFKDTKYGDLTGQVYKGSISLTNIKLTSLEGSPKEVKGAMFLTDNDLTSLEYGPEIVEGIFSVSNNPRLKTLDYAPKKCKDLFYYDTGINPKTEREEICKLRIKADRYFGVTNPFKFEDIKKMFAEYSKYDAIKRKGIRTLFKLDK